MNRIFSVTVLGIGLLALPVHAFEMSFTWGPLKACTSARVVVNSPEFTLTDVPEGTQFIRFKMVDKNYTKANHGGGVVAWAGGAKVPAGAFKYVSPCPPNGSHTYEWTATAQSKKNGGKLGVAKAQRQWPE